MHNKTKERERTFSFLFSLFSVFFFLFPVSLPLPSSFVGWAEAQEAEVDIEPLPSYTKKDSVLVRWTPTGAEDSFIVYTGKDSVFSDFIKPPPKIVRLEDPPEYSFAFEGEFLGNPYKWDQLWIKVVAFDSHNDTIAVSEVVSCTRDTIPPEVDVEPLGVFRNKASFSLSFSAWDMLCASVDSVGLFYRQPPDMAWTFYTWKEVSGDSVVTDSISFKAPADGPYEFYIAGMDSVGNSSAEMGEDVWTLPVDTLAQAKTFVDTQPPVAEMGALGEFQKEMFFDVPWRFWDPEQDGYSSGVDSLFLWGAFKDSSGIISLPLGRMDFSASEEYEGDVGDLGSIRFVPPDAFEFTAERGEGWVGFYGVVSDSAGNRSEKEKEITESFIEDHFIKTLVDTTRPVFSGLILSDTTTALDPETEDISAPGWSNGSLLWMEVEAEDPGPYASGMDSLKLSGDFEREGMFVDTLSLELEGDGQKRIEAVVTDSAGNMSRRTASIEVDTKPPELVEVSLTDTLSGSLQHTKESIVWVKPRLGSLKDLRTGAPIAGNQGWRMLVSEDAAFVDASPMLFDTLKAVTLSEGYGRKTVFCVVSDSAGNWSNVVSNSIIVTETRIDSVFLYDLTDPSDTLHAAVPGWTDSTRIGVRIVGEGYPTTLIASGTRDTAFAIGDGEPFQLTVIESTSESSQQTFEVTGYLDLTALYGESLEDGVLDVTIRAVSEVDTSNEVSEEIHLDRTPPEVRAFRAFDPDTVMDEEHRTELGAALPGWTNSRTVQIELASDAADIHKQYVEEKGGERVFGDYISEGKTFTLTSPDQGRKELLGAVRDSAGNWSDISETEIVLDTEQPIIETFYMYDKDTDGSKPSEETDDDTVGVNLSVSDESTKGFVALREKEEEEDHTLWESLRFGIHVDTLYAMKKAGITDTLTLWVTVQDSAGNHSTSLTTIDVNKEPFKVRVEPLEAFQSKVSFSLSFSAWDIPCASSVGLFYRQSPDTAWTFHTWKEVSGDSMAVGQILFDALADGPYEFYVAGKDCVGNSYAEMKEGVWTLPADTSAQVETLVDTKEPVSYILPADSTGGLPLYERDLSFDVPWRFWDPEQEGCSSGIDSLFLYGAFRDSVDALFLGRAGFSASEEYEGDVGDLGSIRFVPPDAFVFSAGQGEGWYAFYAVAQDSAGNRSEQEAEITDAFIGERFVQTLLDTTRPVFSGLTLSDTTAAFDAALEDMAAPDWSNESIIRMEVEADDPGPYASGTDSLKLRGDFEWEGALVDTMRLELEGDGEKRIEAVVMDRAGNVSRRTSSIEVDTKPPELVEVSLVDTLSGSLQHTKESIVWVEPRLGSLIDLGTGAPIAGNQGWRLLVSEDATFVGALPMPFDARTPVTLSEGYGWKTVYCAVSDSAGNWSETVADSIIVTETRIDSVFLYDLTDLSDTLHAAVPGWTDSTRIGVRIVGEGYPKKLIASGERDTAFAINGKQFLLTVTDSTSESSQQTFEVTGYLDLTALYGESLKDGVLDVTIRAVSEVDTSEEISATIRLDRVSPEVRAFRAFDPDMVMSRKNRTELGAALEGWTNEQEIKIELIPLVEAADVHKLRYGEEKGMVNFEDYTAGVKDFTLTSEQGRKELFGAVRDSAGNWSDSVYTEIVLDTNQPTIDTFYMYDKDTDGSKKSTHTDDDTVGVRLRVSDVPAESTEGFQALREETGDPPHSLWKSLRFGADVDTLYAMKLDPLAEYYTLSVTVQDSAGNFSPTMVDTIIPVIPLAFDLTVWDLDREDSSYSSSDTVWVHLTKDITDPLEISLHERQAESETARFKFFFPKAETAFDTVFVFQRRRGISRRDTLFCTAQHTGTKEKSTKQQDILIDLDAPAIVERAVLEDTTAAIGAFPDDLWDSTAVAEPGWTNDLSVTVEAPKATDPSTWVDRLFFFGADVVDTVYHFEEDAPYLLVLEPGAEEKQTIQYRVTDWVGHRSKSASVEIKYDSEYPSIARTDTLEKLMDTPISLSFHIEDRNLRTCYVWWSGVEDMLQHFDLRGISEVDTSLDVTVPERLLEEIQREAEIDPERKSERTVVFAVVDAAGNVARDSSRVIFSQYWPFAGTVSPSLGDLVRAQELDEGPIQVVFSRAVRPVYEGKLDSATVWDAYLHDEVKGNFQLVADSMLIFFPDSSFNAREHYASRFEIRLRDSVVVNASGIGVRDTSFYFYTLVEAERGGTVRRLRDAPYTIEAQIGPGAFEEDVALILMPVECEALPSEFEGYEWARVGNRTVCWNVTAEKDTVHKLGTYRGTSGDALTVSFPGGNGEKVFRILKYGLEDAPDSSMRALSSEATKGNRLTVSVRDLGHVSGFSGRYYLMVAPDPADVEKERVYNYPNPLDDPDRGTTILYFPPKDAEVRIYDVFGNLVRKLHGERGRVEWDGRNGKGEIVANGGYIGVVEGISSTYAKIAVKKR